MTENNTQGNVLSETEEDSDQDDVDEDRPCGLGSFRPAWMQRLVDPKAYLVVFCILGVLQGAYFTYTLGIVSTIEKRYAFDSKISGIILIADNISPILTSLLIGYYGGRTHRPRLVAFGMLFVCISCLMSALPYLIFGPSSNFLDTSVAQTSRTQLEGPNNVTRYSTCGNSPHKDCGSGPSSATVPAVTLLVIASFLNGFGSNAFYTAGISYLDDSVKKKNSPVYFSTTMAVRLFGPSLGFFLCSVCLKYYEDPRIRLDVPRTDPRWIGAWWMGFLFIFVFLFIFTIPMFFFPRKLRGANKRRDSQANQKLPSLKDLPKHLWRLSKNKVYLFQLMGAVFHINGYMGYYILLPRYMEAHFRKSASEASLLTGSSSVVTMLLGVLIGGLVLRRLKPRARLLSGYMVIVEVTCAALMVVVMFLACPTPNLDAPILDGQAGLMNECNAGCECNTRLFQPVCLQEKQSLYFSPCHAGCTGIARNETTNATIFTTCTCTSIPDEPVDIGLGYCPLDCGLFLAYILVTCAAKFVSATGRVGNTLITLRCVEPEDKTLALGVLSCVISVLAFIPYPLIFGAIADSTCLVWEESCGKTGNCWLYDVDKLRLRVHGSCVIFNVFGIICDLLVWMYSGQMGDIFDEQELELKTLPQGGNPGKQTSEDTEDEVAFLKPAPPNNDLHPSI